MPRCHQEHEEVQYKRTIWQVDEQRGQFDYACRCIDTLRWEASWIRILDRYVDEGSNHQISEHPPL